MSFFKDKQPAEKIASDSSVTIQQGSQYCYYQTYQYVAK